MQSIYAQ
jgi:hypothetical protein